MMSESDKKFFLYSMFKVCGSCIKPVQKTVKIITKNNKWRIIMTLTDGFLCILEPSINDITHF